MSQHNTPLITGRRAVWTAGVLALAGLFVGLQGAPATSSAPAISLKRDSEVVNRGQLERASFADVVKRVSPSVVKITTETKPRAVAARRGGQQQELPPGLEDHPMFRQFFGGRLPEMRQEPQSGLGSGVIISADGYIATNNHVIDGADQLTVYLNDGRELTAKVIGRDPQTDIAVIKVEAKDLPAVTFADTSKVEVGDRVLALGNPFGIGETVTSGIISAKNRRGVGILRDVQGYEDFLQTDAAINPGNSGGALIDVEGRLIGINTAILSRSGGFQGVGLAVPANMVSYVADSLVKNGRVTRAYLGVRMQQLTPDLAESYGAKGSKGALVTMVEEGKPAAKAGLKEEDIITAVNGQAVADISDVTLAVGSLAPGTKVTLDVLRDGKKQQIVATAAERPGSESVSKNGTRRGRGIERFSPTDPSEELAQADNDEGVLNGVTVDDIDRQTRQQLGLPAQVKGALITEVEPDSPSAKAGLRAGDVILSIDGKPVNNAQEAVDLSAKATDKKTRLSVWSRDSKIFVLVDESESGKPNS